MRYALILIGTLGLAATASADHPTQRESRRISEIAHQLRDATQTVRHTARHVTYDPSRRERRAIKKLKKLNKRARKFERSLNRSWDEPYDSRRDFRKLADAYYAAWHAVPVLDRQVYRQFHRVEHLMGRLFRSYNRYGRYGHGHCSVEHRHPRQSRGGHWKGRGHGNGHARNDRNDRHDRADRNDRGNHHDRDDRRAKHDRRPPRCNDSCDKNHVHVRYRSPIEVAADISLNW